MLQLARDLGVQCPAAKAHFMAAAQSVLKRGQFGIESGDRIHQSFEVLNFTMATPYTLHSAPYTPFTPYTPFPLQP